MSEPQTFYTRPLKWAHCGKEGWMSEFSTTIEVDDEGLGEFLLLRQPFAAESLAAGGITITQDEWPTLRAAIDAAFAELKKYDKP